MRSFLITTKGLTEGEAISLMSIGVDFGVTQVVDGNWGIYAIIKKSLFAGNSDSLKLEYPRENEAAGGTHRPGAIGAGGVAWRREALWLRASSIAN
jgi:hypothetical protein